jgi:hypothetical protein
LSFGSIGFGNNMIDLDLSFFGFETESKLFKMIGHEIKFIDRRVEIEENDVFVSFEPLDDFFGNL